MEKSDFPGQPATMFNCFPRENCFPYIQMEPSLFLFMTVVAHSSTVYLGKELGSISSITF